MFDIGRFSKLAGATAISLALLTAGASASVTEVSLNSNTLQSWTTEWTMTSGGENLSAIGNWAFTNFAAATNTWSFSLELTNNSNAGARITSWGLDAPETASNFALLTSPSGWTPGGGQGVMDVDHCVHLGENCAGGGNGGIVNTNPHPVGHPQYDNFVAPTGHFTFSFVSADTDITLNNFLTRWQSVGTDNQGSEVLAPIPLPATGWLMLGILGVGAAAAHRKRKQKQA